MEILHTYQELGIFGATMTSIAGLICIITGMFGFGELIFEKKYKLGLSLIAIFFATALTTLTFYDDFPRDAYHVVSAKELSNINFEKYEIVKQEGLMITLKEN